jgi:hypothetical protein
MRLGNQTMADNRLSDVVYGSVVKVNVRYLHPLTHIYWGISIIVDEFGGSWGLHFLRVFLIAQRIHGDSNEYAQTWAPAGAGCLSTPDELIHVPPPSPARPAHTMLG